MACKKYTISNTGTSVVTFSYQKCDTAEWEYQNQLLPNQVKNVWSLDDTFTVPSFFQNELNITSENFFRGADACTTCNVIDTPCNGQVVISNGVYITGITQNTICYNNTFTYGPNNYPCQDQSITIGPGPGGLADFAIENGIITFLFSSPITSLMFNSGGWGGNQFPGGDRVYITTNVGNPTISQCAGCPMVIQDNMITAVNTNGLARFIVQTTIP